MRCSLLDGLWGFAASHYAVPRNRRVGFARRLAGVVSSVTPVVAVTVEVPFLD
jgi:hypothetical protein